LPEIKVDRLPPQRGNLTATQAAQGGQYQRNEKPPFARRIKHRCGSGDVNRCDRLAFDLRPVTLFQERGRIARDQLPPLGLIEGGEQNAVHVVDGAGRQSALAVASAAFQGRRVGFANVDRLQLR